MQLREDVWRTLFDAPTGYGMPRDYEPLKRHNRPEFSPEAIAAQTTRFLEAGGKIQQIPYGRVMEKVTMSLHQYKELTLELSLFIDTKAEIAQSLGSRRNMERRRQRLRELPQQEITA